MGVQVPSPALEKLAGLAQLVEHLICNQRVVCSSHVAGIKCERSSVVEHHLAKVGVAGSNPVVRFKSRGGGTGRRTGLKILRWQHRTGSIPVLGMDFIEAPLAQLDRVPDYESGG